MVAVLGIESVDGYGRPAAAALLGLLAVVLMGSVMVLPRAVRVFDAAAQDAAPGRVVTVLSFNTEWNSSYCGQGGKAGDANESMDSHANAPFILKAVKLLSDLNQGETPPAAVFSYWVLSDVFDESSGPSGSYILGKNGGQLPFGEVFGLMTAQGMRKAAFNAFKMLNMTGPVRLSSAGGVMTVTGRPSRRTRLGRARRSHSDARRGSGEISTAS